MTLVNARGLDLALSGCVRKPRKEAGEPIRWGVYVPRKRGVRLGTVEAKNIEQALKKAYEEFEISEADRWRISVQRE